MKSREAWAAEAKRRLEGAGFVVRLVDPRRADERKRASRRRDAKLIARGNARPAEIQRKNSFFGGRANRFRIVDYGGLGEGR